jgi:hypothetical protein
MAVYRGEGLQLVNADNSVDAGIYDTWNRLSTGRIKVFRRACQDWQMEFPLYHRDDKGQIVAKRNHLMDCMRYWVRTGMKIATYQPQQRESRHGRRNWRTV